MSHTLLIGDYSYSSWSLRGWLLFRRFDVPVKVRVTQMYCPQVSVDLADFAPSKTVPAMRFDNEINSPVVFDSLAIAETLHEHFPEAGLFPKQAQHRAVARVLAAQMHSGFMSLRDHCPMNLRVAYADCQASVEVHNDVARLAALWAWAKQECASTGTWLCGGYSVADAFFAPVAARIAGYSLPCDGAAMAYVMAHLADPAFRCWRAMGLVHGAYQSVYNRDYEQKPWPYVTEQAEVIQEASAVKDCVNAVCPYSGKAVTYFLRFRNNIYGFCNAFCRDKTAVDPLAWSQFQEIIV